MGLPIGNATERGRKLEDRHRDEMFQHELARDSPWHRAPRDEVQVSVDGTKALVDGSSSSAPAPPRRSRPLSTYSADSRRVKGFPAGRGFPPAKRPEASSRG